MGLYFERDGMRWDAAGTAEEALGLLERTGYDLIVLDINLPGMDGFEFLREIRLTKHMPVLVVSSRKAEEDLVHGLGLGADEFVVKPFSAKVLVARVRAHLRRSSGGDDSERSIFHFADCRCDLESGMLTMRGARVGLTPREMQLLAYLLRASPRTVGVDELYNRVWGKEYGERATVAVHIQRLRRKIEIDPTDPRHIINVYGVGYRFSPESLSTGEED